jgi:hypothetical protein
MKMRAFLSIFAGFLLGADVSVYATDAVKNAPNAAQEQVTAQIVVWAERQAEGEPYPLRLLLTEHALRFDAGNDDDDFLLLNRKLKTIYNVVHADQSVLAVPHVPVEVDASLLAALHLEQSLEAMSGAPKVEGLAPLKLTLQANAETCRTSVVVPELFPSILEAMQEFARVMASLHAANLPMADADKLNACSFADAVLAPTRPLDSGFPVQENLGNGMQRMLYSLEDEAQLPAALFVPPAAYSQKTFSVMR